MAAANKPADGNTMLPCVKERGNVRPAGRRAMPLEFDWTNLVDKLQAASNVPNKGKGKPTAQRSAANMALSSADAAPKATHTLARTPPKQQHHSCPPPAAQRQAQLLSHVMQTPLRQQNPGLPASQLPQRAVLQQQQTQQLQQWPLTSALKPQHSQQQQQRHDSQLQQLPMPSHSATFIPGQGTSLQRRDACRRRGGSGRSAQIRSYTMTFVAPPPPPPPLPTPPPTPLPLIADTAAPLAEEAEHVQAEGAELMSVHSADDGVEEMGVPVQEEVQQLQEQQLQQQEVAEAPAVEEVAYILLDNATAAAAFGVTLESVPPPAIHAAALPVHGSHAVPEIALQHQTPQKQDTVQEAAVLPAAADPLLHLRAGTAASIHAISLAYARPVMVSTATSPLFPYWPRSRPGSGTSSSNHTPSQQISRQQQQPGGAATAIGTTSTQSPMREGRAAGNPAPPMQASPHQSTPPLRLPTVSPWDGGQQAWAGRVRMTPAAASPRRAATQLAAAAAAAASGGDAGSPRQAAAQAASISNPGNHTTKAVDIGVSSPSVAITAVPVAVVPTTTTAAPPSDAVVFPALVTQRADTEQQQLAEAAAACASAATTSSACVDNGSVGTDSPTAAGQRLQGTSFPGFGVLRSASKTGSASALRGPPCRIPSCPPSPTTTSGTTTTSTSHTPALQKIQNLAAAAVAAVEHAAAAMGGPWLSNPVSPYEEVDLLIHRRADEVRENEVMDVMQLLQQQHEQVGGMGNSSLHSHQLSPGGVMSPADAASDGNRLEGGYCPGPDHLAAEERRGLSAAGLLMQETQHMLQPMRTVSAHDAVSQQLQHQTRQSPHRQQPAQLQPMQQPSVRPDPLSRVEVRETASGSAEGTWGSGSCATSHGPESAAARTRIAAAAEPKATTPDLGITARESADAQLLQLLDNARSLLRRSATVAERPTAVESAPAATAAGLPQPLPSSSVFAALVRPAHASTAGLRFAPAASIIKGGNPHLHTSAADERQQPGMAHGQEVPVTQHQGPVAAGNTAAVPRQAAAPARSFNEQRAYMQPAAASHENIRGDSTNPAVTQRLEGRGEQQQQPSGLHAAQANTLMTGSSRGAAAGTQAEAPDAVVAADAPIVDSDHHSEGGGDDGQWQDDELHSGSERNSAPRNEQPLSQSSRGQFQQAALLQQQQYSAQRRQDKAVEQQQRRQSLGVGILLGAAAAAAAAAGNRHDGASGLAGSKRSRSFAAAGSFKRGQLQAAGRVEEGSECEDDRKAAAAGVRKESQPARAHHDPNARLRDAFRSRKSLVGDGMTLDEETGRRKSTRQRQTPLEYWRNEGKTWERTHRSLPTVKDVSRKSPDPQWPAPSEKDHPKPVGGNKKKPRTK